MWQDLKGGAPNRHLIEHRIDVRCHKSARRPVNPGSQLIYKRFLPLDHCSFFLLPCKGAVEIFLEASQCRTIAGDSEELRRNERGVHLIS